jgi:hypothetical protein
MKESPSLNHGNIPCWYAFKRRGVDKSPPIAINPLGSFKAFDSVGNSQLPSIHATRPLGN